MTMDVSVVGQNSCPQQARFVKEKEGSGSAYGYTDSHVDINDVANLHKEANDYWEASSKSHALNPDGTEKYYHFDDKGAKQILNYKA